MLPLMVGSVVIPLVVDLESEVCVPALPLLLRFLYSAIASASRSRTLDAIGARTDAASFREAFSVEVESNCRDVVGENVENDCE